MYVLLVEPDYKNKYPPLGLMKISMYHKQKGDTVSFVKGFDKNFQERIWDRIYVTSLFTFHYDITIKTIRYYKSAVHNTSDLFVGGILASLMPERIKLDTGIQNIIIGQLDDSSKVGFSDKINIDCLTPDYDILDEIKHKYPAGDNYFAYTTRGCPNRCTFCAVPKLEPEFKTTNNIYDQIQEINKLFGAKKDLLLLDNNILHSPNLKFIVNDILKAGFVHSANFIETYKFEIIYSRLNNKTSLDEHEVEKFLESLTNFRKRIKSEDCLSEFDDVLAEIQIGEDVSTNIDELYPRLQKIIEKYRNKTKKRRYVDFNQGIDAGLLNESNVKVLCKIPIKPLRIAFDDIRSEVEYVRAVRLAAKNGIREISNYLLYNFKDRPEDLWRRLKINTDLKEELNPLNVSIFSFPMKYIPVNEIDRSYIGKLWNKKFLRGIQAVLLVKKGIVSTNRAFVEKAFGKTIEEYFEILSMPEDFIIYRFFFEKNGLTSQWQQEYFGLNKEEKDNLLELLSGKITDPINNAVSSIMKYYKIKYADCRSAAHLG